MVPPSRGIGAPQCYMCGARTGGGNDKSGDMPKAPVCTDCTLLNAKKRDVHADLTGATALVTGGRTKIGFETALKLLRCGATVIIISRFPCCAAQRFSSHPEAQQDWAKRLHIYGIDLRHLRSLDSLCEHLVARYVQLDIIVHNAAQTVRRPPAYYSAMFDQERILVSSCLSGGLLDESTEFGFVSRVVKVTGCDPHADTPDPEGLADALAAHAIEAQSVNGLRGRQKRALLQELDKGLSGGDSNGVSSLVKLLRDADSSEASLASGQAAFLSSVLAMVPLLPSDDAAEQDKELLFPAGGRDLHGEQLDLRTSTSWTSHMDEVPLLELMEVLVVNAVAPFVLTSRLLPLSKAAVRAGGRGAAFVVAVSSQEGVFNRDGQKAPEHPHTNMSKAALNMFTRTVASQLAPSNVFLTAVDTGWISQMRPGAKRLPPLSEEDGAARVLDPVLSGLEMLRQGETPLHGCLLKNFKVVDW